MDEEKKGLPPVKEFLERMYGVEISDPTPEELERKKAEWAEYARRKDQARGSKDGRKDM